MAPPRWTEYLPVATLQPAPRNAKAHDLDALQRSLEAFGALEPVVLDERTTRLVSGHGRVEKLSTLEAAGAEPPEGVVVDGHGRWCWLVTLVHVPAEGHQAIVRDDTWAVLATPTDSFKLIQHSQMGDLLAAYSEAWTKAGADVKFETAGSVRGGAMVWALVWLDEPWHAPGDDSPTYPFAALLNAHDGSAACRLTPTSVRIVCWNTWKAAEAEGERSAHSVVLRHAGNVEARLEDAKASLTGMREEAKAWQMLATDLTTININDAVVRTFLDEFIPVPEGASERTRNSRLERQATFLGLYNDSPTNNGLPTSAYRLVQAAGEYLDHLRPFRNADTYLARTMFTSEPIKGGVVRRVRELANELA
jgi:phage/plasmid-like protein (TIGR03299 family)